MKYSFRNYQAQDAQAIARVFRSAIVGVAAKDYEQEQIEAWLANAPSVAQFAAKYADGRLALVAVDRVDEVVAFIDLESDGHIDMFYALPEAAGTDLTIRLYNLLEENARHLKLDCLYTEASEAARSFFLRRGFVEKHRRDLTVGGVSIHNYAMEKALR